MTEKELENLCVNTNTPFDRVTVDGVARLRVLDATLLPGAFRPALDQAGVVKIDSLGSITVPPDDNRFLEPHSE